jgi:phage major head subunit gpT-like protein/phage head maturation protease
MPLDLVLRRAELAPATVNEAARTVEVTFTTGAGVRRRDAAGPFLEVLATESGAVDLSAFIGAAVLDGHRQDGLDRVLGVVVSATVVGGIGRAVIKFSERAEPIWRDVKAGIIRGVSVGYSVQQWADSRAPDGSRIRTAVRWTPRELSLVAVPADPGATIRSEESMMLDATANTDAVQTQPPPAPQSQAPADTQNRAAINGEIRQLGQRAGLDQATVDRLIDRGATVEQARAAMFDALVGRDGEPIRNHHVVQTGPSGDDPAVITGRMAEALHCRIDPTQKPSDSAKPYLPMRFIEMARFVLGMRGERGLAFVGPDELLKRAHATGDFPNLLTGTGNRVLLAAYQAAPNPLKMLARQTTIADFRAKTALKLSGMPKLKEVAEHGEVTHVTRSEAKESYSLKTFASIFTVTRNAIINDDLGAFGDFGRAAGQAAAETEADQLVSLLTANSGNGVTMDDTKALFHADHGNKAGSGGAIDTTTLSAARLAMRIQKGLDGVTPIAVTPKFLLVSPAKETEAEAVLATLAAAELANVNVFSGKLQLAVEPRLTGNAWRIFADPAQAPVLEYAYLSSAQGPQMASREGWDVLGLEFRVMLDFGCGVVDHRGAYLNPGA